MSDFPEDWDGTEDVEAMDEMDDDPGRDPLFDDDLFMFAIMDEEQRRHGYGPAGQHQPGGCLILLAAGAAAVALLLAL